MSVRAYHLRRKAYRQTAKPVSNPGQPSPVNRKARRRDKQPGTVWGVDFAASIDETYIDPDPPLKCDCGQCLPGQDRTCPATQLLDPRD